MLNTRKLVLLLTRRGPLPFSTIVRGLGPIQYLPLNDASGLIADDASANNLDGAYTDVMLGTTGIGDGDTAATFNGTTSKCNVYSAGLVSAFNPLEGSILIYGKVSGAGVWTDGTSRRLVNLYADNNNIVYISKASVNNLIECYYRAGGISKGANIITSTTDWFCVVLTWSKSNDRARVYFNSFQNGSDLTGLGTWAGNLANFSYVGARDTNSNVWSGDLAHYALYDRELTQAEIDRVFFLNNQQIAMAHSDDQLRFVWITDTHVVSDTSASRVLNLESAVADLNTWQPNALISTGDVGNNPTSTVRKHFEVMQQARRPVYTAIGNHDEHEYDNGAGNGTNVTELEGTKFFNRSAPFNQSFQLISGDGTVKSRCLILESNIYDDDPGGITISPYHEPGNRCGASTEYPGNGWWRLFNTETLTWVETQLAADTESQMVLVFVHFPPAGATMTNYEALIDLLQTDGRPAIGFSGHVHPDATSYTQASTDGQYDVTFYKAPAMLESGCWTRVTLGWNGSAITTGGMEIHNYTDPGGWVINEPFTVAA